MSTVVVGHKNPDTDSIVAAIATADLMTKRGEAARAFRQGGITPETAFVLQKFGLAAPDLLEDASNLDIILVDHSDRSQAPENIGSARVAAVVDHHKLGDITTSTPLLMWVWPVGCTCTVIKNMYDFYGIAVPADIAGVMLGAILSDTLIFKSPTTTAEDRAAALDLAQKSGVTDMQAFGMDMFKVKSAVEGVPAKELLFRDYKDFDMNGKKVGVGQLEVIDITLLDGVKDSLKKAVREAQAQERHTVFLLLTDIIREGSELIYATSDESVVAKTFGVSGGDAIWLPGIMSRKKDVIPKLEAAMK